MRVILFGGIALGTMLLLAGPATPSNGRIDQFIYHIPQQGTPSCSGSGVTICSTSGTLSHGSSLTITGLNFGTKATAAPYMYDDFSSGSPNGTWSETYLDDPGGCGSMSTSNPRTNFTRQIRYNFKASCDGNMSHMTLSSSQTNRIWYTTFYARTGDAAGSFTWPTTCTAGSTSLANIKLFRYWGPSDPGDESAIITWDSGDCIGFGMNWFNKGSTQHGVSYDQTTDWSNNVWHFVEVAFTDSSSTSATDGALQMWIDGSQEINASNVDFRDTNNLKRPIDLGPWNSWGGAGSSADHFWDETGVYAEKGGLWRVVICPNSTFTGRGKCEIQVPTAWSNTSITVTLKQGEFASFSGKYLYIVDSIGNVNTNGFLFP